MNCPARHKLMTDEPPFRTGSYSKQRLVVIEQDRIDFKDIVDPVFNAVFNDEVKYAARRKRISRALKQIDRFIKIKPECDRERHGSLFARAVIRIGTDL